MCKKNYHIGWPEGDEREEKRLRSDGEMREEGRRVGGVGKREKGRMVKLL